MRSRASLHSRRDPRVVVTVLLLLVLLLQVLSQFSRCQAVPVLSSPSPPGGARFQYFEQGLREPTEVETFTFQAVADQLGHLFAVGYMTSANSPETTVQFQDLPPVNISSVTGFVVKYRNSDGRALWQTTSTAEIVPGATVTYVEESGRLFYSGAFIGQLYINGEEQVGLVANSGVSAFLTELDPLTGKVLKTIFAMVATWDSLTSLLWWPT